MERLSAVPHQDRLSLQAPPEASPPPNGSTDFEPQPTPVYHTGLGCLSFDQLYQQTSRTVGYVMRESLGMTNPEDIDDCMQSGYLKVWQKLQVDPHWLADKPKRYITQAVVLCSKAQRYSHLRHYRKIVYDAQPGIGEAYHHLTTKCVDTWMDIAQALGQVAGAVEDDPLMLLSFYTLITDTKAVDVSRELGVNYKTLAKRRPKTRSLVAQALADYRPAGTHSHNGIQTSTSNQTATRSPMVTPWLVEDKPALWSAVDPAPDLQSVASEHRLEPHYPTRWGSAMTLEQILTDPHVQRAAFAKADRLGLDTDDQQDCIQRGAIKLWQTLRDNPTLLTAKGPQWVGIYLAYSGDPKQFHRHHQRQRTFRDPGFDWQDADEYLRIGLLSDNQPSHAQWTTEIDETLDVQCFVDAMMRHYANNPRKQVALQALIGTISTKEAAQQLGIHEKNFAASIGNSVRQEVQALLPETMKAAQSESWEAQLARGEGVDYISEIALEVQDNQRLLLALYVVTTSAKKKDVAEMFGFGLTAFGKDIRQIKQMIADRYRRDRLRQ